MEGRLRSGGIQAVRISVRLASGCGLGSAVELLAHVVLLGRDQLLSDLSARERQKQGIRDPNPQSTGSFSHRSVWMAVTGHLQRGELVV